ncbi:DMT family transporter [Francisella sp. XLW-1]|uniref:DMT family transporter n=1 Tax=Francisella sp. XLW-1 TaxID=2610887 RepID=UPI00123D8B96|nr:EamA family transporter [Francisella sp. XLW-1]
MINNQTNISSAICFALLASISMTLVGFFSRFDVSILFLLLVRCFVPLIIMLTLLYYLRITVSLINIKSHFIRSVFFIINQASFFYTVKHSSVLMGTLLFNTAPLFIPILIYLFFKERVKKSIILASIVGLIGVCITLHPSSESFLNVYSIVGIISGFSLACSQIILQKNVRNESNLSCMLWFYVFSTMIAVLISAYAYIFNNYSVFEVDYHSKGLWVVIIGISLSTLSYQFFTGKSYQKWNVKNLAPIMYTSIFFAGILDIIFWNKFPTLIEIFGMLIIIISCIFVIRNR